MPDKRSRFVRLSRHGLAVGTVLALAAPSATLVDLDVVAPRPETGVGSAPTGRAGAALVAAEPVVPKVRESRIPAVQGPTTRARAQQNAGNRLAARSEPELVHGLATVGVTWKPGTRLDEDDIAVSVRTLDDGVWSAWQDIEYHDDHGPDPDSAEARRARPGTDPIVVGDVDQVQVKALTRTGEAPADLRLVVVDPGAAAKVRLEQPAIDTAELGSTDALALSSAETTVVAEETVAGPTADDGTTEETADGTTGDPTGDQSSDAQGVLTALPAYVTPKPRIFSRAQWGADERMRDPSSLRYYEVHAGFVHHTVNANGYTRSQVPSLIRGIYAYHTQGKGWSDIGYNFVVDRFGRIWEGRYGGVDRPVVGAHTLGYNDYSFAMSALGNFEKAKPSPAMVDAYGRLFAWKLSLHGVDASSWNQQVGGSTFPAINGHRDAGSTACPGAYLYRRLGRIRTLASSYQSSFDGRSRTANISGSKWPDLVVREKDTQRALVIRTGGQVRFYRSHIAARRWGRMDLIAATHDLNGDGRPDMLARVAATGESSIYPGTADGTYDVATRTNRRFSEADQLLGTRDLTGDGRNDVVARIAETGRLYVYPGNRRGGLSRRRLLSAEWGEYDLTVAAGDLTGDGRNDLVARTGAQLHLVPGTDGGLGDPIVLPGRWGGYDIIAGGGDLTNDRKPDLLVRGRRGKMTFIYPGDGQGGFGHRYGPFASLAGADFVAVTGQLAGNWRRDLVVRKPNGRLVAYGNNGRKNIARVVDTGDVYGGANMVLNVGDWDGDGRGDIMTRVARTGTLLLRLRTGPREFAGPVVAGTGFGDVRLLTAVGDITGDGRPDLVGQPKGRAMRIYPGDGATGFKPSYVAHSAIGANRQMGVGLWNGDGSPDTMVRRNGDLVVYPGNGPGGLTNPVKVASGTGVYDWLLGIGDADGNGRPDILARERETGRLWLLPGQGDGFGRRMFVAEGFDKYNLVG